MPDIWMDVDTAVVVPVNIAPLVDDTDFKTIETAVVYNSAGLAVTWNFVTSAGVVSGTAVTPTTAGVYDWSEPIADKGMYAIEIPASGGASINNDTEGYGWFTGVATGVLPWRGPTIGFRAAGLNDKLCDSAYDTTRGLAGTALPAAAADAAGGLPISDAGGLDLDAERADVAAILVDTGTTLDGRIPASLTANGNMKSSLMEILTTALTETAGQIAGAFKKFFNVAAPTGTVNSLPDAVAGAAGGVFIAGTNAATSIVAAAGDALTLTGQGTGAGLRATGGATGPGFVAQAGATGPNHGMHCVGVGAGGNGILGQGASDATGVAAGLKVLGAGGGIGLYAEGADGIFTAGGSGGPGGHGINAVSVLAGSGLNCVGAGAGSGIGATGGATNGHGMLLQGTAGGAGIQASGGATGQGFTALGGATSGAGILALAAASGAGINAVGAGGGADIDANELAAIQADTDNIQTRLPAALVGGRMDSDIGAKTGNVALSTQEKADVNAEVVSATAAIKAATDNLPSAIKKNTARVIPFKMVLASDHVSAGTGLTITAQRSLDGAAFGACAGAVAEVGSGWYTLSAAAGDLNGDSVALKFTAATADQRDIAILTEP